jgi:hypothetical protein
VHVAGLLDRVDRDDVGVVQRGDGARFAGEALAPLPVRGQRRRQDLERDRARERRVLGWLSGRGVSRRIADTTAAGFAPSKGRRPVSSS